MGLLKIKSKHFQASYSTDSENKVWNSMISLKKEADTTFLPFSSSNAILI